MRTLPGILLLPAALLLACGRAEPPAAQRAAPAQAQVILAGASGSVAGGRLQLTAVPGGVRVTGELRGLALDAEHGFHVHEHGDCSAPDAESAGDHFNPDQVPHGGPAHPVKHLGDMPNIRSDAWGAAAVDVVLEGATLRDGGASDLLGRAVVVHADRDDYVSQPAGDSGARIACGVVEQGQPR